MKKLIICLAMAVILLMGLPFTASAADTADCKFDTSKKADGLVSVTYQGDTSRRLKVCVVLNQQQYIYDINQKGTITMPLQLGTGSYTVRVMREVTSNKYSVIAAETFTVDKIDELKMFSSSVVQVNTGTGTKSLEYYNPKIEEKEKTVDKIKTMYDEMVKNYKYDYDKAKTVASGYVPDMDTVYGAKKGICYDYGVMFAGVLRSNGIPTKLVMGYSPDIKEYHAWNQVYLDGKWYTIDTTMDAVLIQAGKTTKMNKDGSLYSVVKVY